MITKVLTSEWSSPTVNVLKSKNSVRVCGDYSGSINKYMKVARFPLPTIEEVISKVGKAKWFSRIDAYQAFNQLPLNEESKCLTNINTSEGMYRYNYLCFGTASSPAIFQNFMCRVLEGVPNIVIYQDDVCIMTETLEQHNLILDQVLGKLRNVGLKINRKKCEFYANEIFYIGHKFDANGVHVIESKARALLMPISLKILSKCNRLLVYVLSTGLI